MVLWSGMVVMDRSSWVTVMYGSCAEQSSPVDYLGNLNVKTLLNLLVRML